MKHFLKSLSWACAGLRNVWNEERNFRTEVAIAAIVVIAAFVRHFSAVQWVFLVIAITLVLMAEIVNTVVEDICDKVQPDQDPAIEKIKDMMAACVTVSSVAAIIIGFFIFLA